LKDGLGGYGSGYPGLGFGYGYGYPAYGPAPAYAAYPYYGPPGFLAGYTGPGSVNPYFSVGLSPLAVQSALGERYTLGRTGPAVRSGMTRGGMGVYRP